LKGILVERVKVGVLRLFANVGHFMVPRYLFYSVWLSTMVIAYISLYGITGGVHNFYALVFGFLTSLILWIETIKLWREKPF
jgi:hypothetical protein